MALTVDVTGSFDKLADRLKRFKLKDPRPILEYYGQAGVDALVSATPVDTGLTATSWYYELERTDDGWVLSWNNSNIQNGIQIAILIQMGHATRSGGWVQGVDYINPALRDIFNKFSVEIGKELSE